MYVVRNAPGLECTVLVLATVWCRRGESNPRPRDYETLALPLSYAGPRQFSMLRTTLYECQANHRERSTIAVSPAQVQAGARPSTTVPLTLQVLKPTMPMHDLLRCLRRGRKPGEETNPR